MTAVIAGIVRVAGLLGFSLSPVLAGAIFAGVLTAGLGIGVAWIRHDATMDERRKCEAAAWKAKFEATAVDLAAARAAADEAAAARAESDAEAQTRKQEAQRYAEELKGRPNGACTLTDDDVRWLYGDAPRGGAGRPRAPARR